jgi:hypothetical protein
MEAGVRESPARQVGRAFGLAARSGQLAVPAFVPIDRRLIQVIPGELVEDEQGRQRGELVEGRREWVDVVEDTLGDDRIERTWVVELLERDLAVERAFRRVRIDGENVVARLGQGRGDATVGSASNLQRPCARARELGQHELSELHETSGAMRAKERNISPFQPSGECSSLGHRGDLRELWSED